MDFAQAVDGAVPDSFVGIFIVSLEVELLIRKGIPNNKRSGQMNSIFFARLLRLLGIRFWRECYGAALRPERGVKGFWLICKVTSCLNNLMKPWGGSSIRSRAL